MRPPYFINDVLFFKYLYSRNICKKQKLFLGLEFLHCGVWTINSGFVFGDLIPGTYCHIPGAFLHVCKGYSYGIFAFCTFQIFLNRIFLTCGGFVFVSEQNLITCGIFAFCVNV